MRIFDVEDCAAAISISFPRSTLIPFASERDTISVLSQFKLLIQIFLAPFPRKTNHFELLP
jgi:hypothetical protein